MFLKTKEVDIPELGARIEIRELSAKAQIEIIGAQNRGDEGAFDGVFIACRHGVTDWLGKGDDELRGEITLRQATAVARLVYELSGLNAAEEAQPGN